MATAAPSDEKITTSGYDRTSVGAVTAETIEAYKRGIDWLQREIPALQDFARAWSGKKNLRVEVGPLACTDGEVIYLKPPMITKGEIEPSRAFLALLYHEVAHVVHSQVYDGPPIPENALKIKADLEFGQPGGFILNGLEDGRVEELLYRDAPGARKHIRALVGDLRDATLKRLNEPEPPETREMADDLALMLATYYVTAGHRETFDQFPQRIITDMTSDEELVKIVNGTHEAESTKQVMRDLTGPFMKRARELGYFADFDPRSIDPSTGQPKNMKWEDLTEEEREQLRQQVKEQMKGGKPNKPEPGQETVGVQLPSDELEKLAKEAQQEMQESGEQAADEENEAGQQEGGQGDGQNQQQGAQGEQSAQSDTGQPQVGDESGETTEQQSGGETGEQEGQTPTAPQGPRQNGSPGSQTEQRTSPSPDGEQQPEDGQEAQASQSGSGSGNADERDSDTEVSDEVITDAQIETAAREEHERREAERIRRAEELIERFEEIEETVRPPHAEYRKAGEIPYGERETAEVKAIEAAQRVEVGHIRGEAIDGFIYEEFKAVGSGNMTGPQIMAQFADTISGTLNRLRAVFKQNRKSSFAGRYEMGQHVNGRALTGFAMKEHFKPFDRKINPKKLDYAVTLLIDQSGSMREAPGSLNRDYYYNQAAPGSKIVMARTAVAMQAEMLHRLQIPFEVLGFTTQSGDNARIKHSVFKSYDEPWNSDTVNRVLAIVAESSNLDGFALAWAWERLQRRREKVKILISYSDGQPAPDTTNQTRIMKYVLRKMQLNGAVPIGVGIMTTAVDQLYPKVVHCTDLRTLPKQMVALLEQELKKK